MICCRLLLNVSFVSLRCNRRDVDTTNFKVEDLTEGDEYEFRVIAYNEAGPSRPSTTAGPVIIQDQTCKPNTLRSSVKDMWDLGSKRKLYFALCK